MKALPDNESNLTKHHYPPELLAPAGDADCIRAAIENGADAVYFGLDCGFNARARAHNFRAADLHGILEGLHHRGLSGYVTLNTLVFPSELEQAVCLLQQISAAQVDAVLVQDIGLARLIRELTPDLPIHASTQMTMTSAECISELEDLGIERVVVGRELSVREIKKIGQKTQMPIEVFVHGALCVAYSGQCLTSESLGGRSANRGQCAQACRLPYELIVDGEERELGDQKYLLSPQDLAAYGLVPDLIDAGVCSLKIEGRLKTPEYVANITRHYRKAIDEAMAGRQAEFSSDEVSEMELSFSRGFSHGWLEGCDHKMLVPGVSSSKRGVKVGVVQFASRKSVSVELLGTLERGDGVVFEGDRTQDGEQGGRVYDVRISMSNGEKFAELEFAHGTIDFESLYPGQLLWKTDDPKLNDRLRQTFTGKDPLQRRAVNLEAVAEIGQPLKVTARIDGVKSVSVQSDQPMEEARKHPVDGELLSHQLGRLGGTPYRLGKLTTKITGRPMLPLSVIGRMRRTLVEELDRAAKIRPVRRFNRDGLATLKASASDIETCSVEPSLHVLCRTMEQMKAAVGFGIDNLYADFHDIREFRSVVEFARQESVSVFLATPRIQKPDEFGLFRAMRRHSPDGFLVRNLAGMRYFHDEGFSVVADFSLNVTNELTADFFAKRGVKRVTASYDLNRDQLLELINATPKSFVEIVLHQHMPMFHMEHCVFCSVMSPGTNKTNCGRPCDRHVVQLRDRVGMEHPLQADVGCRNTLFNATAQSAAEVVPDLVQEGVKSFRIELLEESKGDIRKIISLYSQLIAGNVSGSEVWAKLKASNRVGVTRGTLEEKRNPLTII